MLNKVLIAIGYTAIIASGTIADGNACEKLENNLRKNHDHIKDLNELSEEGAFEEHEAMENILDIISETITKLNNNTIKGEKECKEVNDKIADDIKKATDKATIQRATEIKNKYRAFGWQK